MLTGKYLINLDSEDEGELFIGCAGGVDTVAKFSPMVTPAPDGFEYFRIDVKGLAGGHSGDDIEKGAPTQQAGGAAGFTSCCPTGRC